MSDGDSPYRTAEKQVAEIKVLDGDKDRKKVEEEKVRLLRSRQEVECRET